MIDTEFCTLNYVPNAKICSSLYRGFFFPGAWSCAPSPGLAIFHCFVSCHCLSQGTHTDQYVKRCTSVQGCVFLGSEKQSLILKPSPKLLFLEPFWCDKIFDKISLMGMLKSKLPLIVIIAHKSCMVNRQIGVGNFKYVIVSDFLCACIVLNFPLKWRMGHYKHHLLGIQLI